jgi:hypothetical protein
MSGSGDEIENEDVPPISPIIITGAVEPSTPEQNKQPQIISTPPTAVKAATIDPTYSNSPGMLRGVALSMEESTQSKTGSNTKTATASNRKAITASQNLFSYLYNKNLTREKVRTTLAIESNQEQMANVWGLNIVNWAKCEGAYDICPCCYLCGLPINYFNISNQTPPQMEHKIPSINAYLNVPNFLRTKNTPFWNNWQTYITNARISFNSLKELYNLINCTDNYDAYNVNRMFNEIFDSAGLNPPNEKARSDYTYWRNLLKFWMMEFAYAHVICNGAKSMNFICGGLRSGATAEDDVVSDKDTCVDNIISTSKYKAFVESAGNRMSTYQEGMIFGSEKGKNTKTFKELLNGRKNRTTNMFNELIATLDNVQNLYFQRMPGQTEFAKDIMQEAIIATNIRYAAVYPQIKGAKRDIDKLLDAIENTTNQIDNISEAIEALESMKPKVRSPRNAEQQIRSNQRAISEYKKDVETLKSQSETYSQQIDKLWPGTLLAAAGGEETSGNLTPPPSFMAIPPSAPRPSDNHQSSNQKRRTAYPIDDKSGKKGGTIKNKRRSQKLLASSRRKRNKKPLSRRKRYTRKQKI